jgi:hypothetical protein
MKEELMRGHLETYRGEEEEKKVDLVKEESIVLSGMSVKKGT